MAVTVVTPTDGALKIIGAVVAVGLDGVPISGGGGSGDVVGPASATANALVLFNSTTGKLIKDSAVTIDTDGTLAANSDSRVATQKAVKTYADAAQAAAEAASATATQGAKADTALQPLTDQIKTASFTIGVADLTKNTRVGHATVDIDITVPDATFIAGQDLFGYAFGVAQVAFVAGDGVTINSKSDLLDLVKNTGWQLHCVSATEFDLMACLQ